MKIFLIIVASWIAFCLLDAVAYGFAKYPERTRNEYYKWPGGGFVALIRFGRDR